MIGEFVTNDLLQHQLSLAACCKRRLDTRWKRASALRWRCTLPGGRPLLGARCQDDLAAVA